MGIRKHKDIVISADSEVSVAASRLVEEFNRSVPPPLDQRDMVGCCL